MEATQERETVERPGPEQAAVVPESARIPKRGAGRRAFAPKRLRTLAAVIEVMLSDETAEGLMAPSPELVGRVTDELDLWIGAGSADLRRGYRVLAWLIEWLPLLTGFFGRTSRLSLSRRLAFFWWLEHARLALLSTLVVAFKLPVMMLAFELDPELRVTGFDRATISTPRSLLRPRGPVQSR